MAAPADRSNNTASPPTLASVIVLKIQDFARKPVAEQVKLKARLESLVGLAIKPLPAAGRIVLDTSDGIAVVVPGRPRAALALAERSQAAADIPLCIGVNHGPVKAASDALRGSGVVGDGIASGMTLANAAAPGRFVASRSFREALKTDSPARAAALRAAGMFTDANVRTHELFTVDRQAARARRWRLVAFGTLTIAAIIGTGFGARFARLAYEPPPPPPPRPALIHLQITPRGDVFIDGVRQGASPPLTQVEVDPGPRTIEVRNSPNPPLRLKLSLAAGEEMTISHSFVAPKAPAKSAPKSTVKRTEKKVEKRPEESRRKTPGDYWRQFRREIGF
jgi:class 3 adenylate cyclase